MPTRLGGEALARKGVRPLLPPHYVFRWRSRRLLPPRSWVQQCMVSSWSAGIDELALPGRWGTASCFISG
eukprot:1966730-Amphidinium_carterae.1